MDTLLDLVARFIGDDTDPIDLLPLVVLGFLLVSVRYLRAMMLRMLTEIGALRERIDIMQELRHIRRVPESPQEEAEA